MNFSKQQEFIVILSIIETKPNNTRKAILDNIYNKKYINFIENDFQLTNNALDGKWKNELSFCRQHLIEKDVLGNIKRGYWDLKNYENYFEELLQSAAKLEIGKDFYISDNAIRAAQKRFYTILKSDIQNEIEIKNDKVKFAIENDNNITIIAKEGKPNLKLHLSRECNPEIIKRKKEKIFHETGKLICEICQFDFFNQYGEIGLGFIECHHNKPISEYDEDSVTTLDDLYLVCSNCHSMLHRKTLLSIEDLRKLFQANK